MNYDEYKNLTWQDRCAAFRRIVLELQTFRHVSISRERDYHVENAGGDDVVEWEVEIGAGRRSISVSDLDLERAIVEASHKATKADTEEDAAREARRQAALGKLNADDRRILGLP